MENVLGISRINTFRLHYDILVRNQWKILQEIPGVFLIRILFQSQYHMLLQVPEPIPSNSFINSKSTQNSPGTPWARCFTRYTSL